MGTKAGPYRGLKSLSVFIERIPCGKQGLKTILRVKTRALVICHGFWVDTGWFKGSLALRSDERRPGSVSVSN